jgi:hypothetical protein
MAEQAILHQMQDNFSNPGLCWKSLKSICNPDPTVAIDVSTLIEDFRGVFHCRDRALLPSLGPGQTWGETSPKELLYDEPFTDSELVAALRALNSQAATCPELVPSAVLCDVFLGEAESWVSLLALMNFCFQTGTVRAAWGESELFILYKGKGLRTVADNFRATTLSKDFRRIYERLLIARLIQWSVHHNATGSMQFGFKKAAGTMEAIFVLRSIILHATRICCAPGFVCFVDLR